MTSRERTGTTRCASLTATRGRHLCDGKVLDKHVFLRNPLLERSAAG